ncbi:hypothetical protein FA15DRAFT_671755 [Coprinopsis marcescibilis]|uniref:Uncharacterized protein n=1 Tax=Coprinopsis marcescibilis TaxID=230819 RepID=A0A5C3KNW6_COPMA|nr:hypothetical protein FA15DRAFT_671755 [Coprinopsis marcescibilis]
MACSSEPPDRLLQLMKCNDPLDEEDVAVTRSFIYDRQSSLSTLQERQAQLEEQIAELNRAKRTLTKEIAQQTKTLEDCNRLLSFSRLLPPEILYLIFIYATPSTDQSHVHQQQDFGYLASPPISISQVCCSWRHLAFSIPELWSSFSIRAFQDSRLRIKSGPFKHMLTSYFSNARDLPTKSLHIHFGMNASEHRIYLELLVKSIIESVEPQNLTLGYSGDLSRFLDVLNAMDPHVHLSRRLKKVRSLVLREDYSESTRPFDDSEFTFPSFLSKLSSLRQVSVEHHRSAAAFSTLLSEQLLPWRQLTHLIIVQWIKSTVWERIFGMCNSLKHGLFYIEADTDPNDSTTVPTFSQPNYRYPDLADLTIIYNRGIASLAPGFQFQPYLFPTLQNLRLGAYHHPHRSSAFNWHNIQTEIYKLTNLSLCYLTWEVEAAGIVELLLATPNVVSLVLGVATDYDAVFERFQIDWNGQTLLPKLEELWVECESGSSSTYDDALVRLTLTSDGFLDMVRDRFRPIDDLAQLKRVGLVLPRTYITVLERVRVALKREVEEGLDLFVDSTSSGPKNRSSQRQAWTDPFLGPLTHWNQGLLAGG